MNTVTFCEEYVVKNYIKASIFGLMSRPDTPHCRLLGINIFVLSQTGIAQLVQPSSVARAPPMPDHRYVEEIGMLATRGWQVLH